MWRALLAVIVVGTLGCEPWPLTNPDDPFRCEPGCQDPEVCLDGICVYDACRYSPCLNGGTCTSDATARTFSCQCRTGFAGATCEQCATGYIGYPSCQRDFCFQNTCSGRGTCSSGACMCSSLYAGTTCERCAGGKIDYPTCRCDCTGTSVSCDGTQSIRSCDGCTTTSATCASVCGNRQGAFCATDPAVSSIQACWCVDAGRGAIAYEISTSCTASDIRVGVYDADRSYVALASSTVLNTTTPFREYIQCIPGNKICWGAWRTTTGSFWGCGENCGEACTGCCTLCPSSGRVILQADGRRNLTCN